MLSPIEIKRVEILLNNRPTKVLHFETPIERFPKLTNNIKYSSPSRAFFKKICLSKLRT